MRIKVVPEDFLVEEIPAYEPSGKGGHVFVTIEKTGVTTMDAVKAIAAALKIDPRDVGTAGLKDKQAVARQRISLPAPATPEAALALAVPGVRVLAAVRHEQKLKTGHLRGNRFTLRVRDAGMSVDELRARLAELARPPGVANFYGDQRLAKGNADKGRALLRGERVTADGRMRRFFVSAWQSELFNRWLERRIADGLYRVALAGDVMKKVETGGVFLCEDPEKDTARVVAGEIAPSGPMFGAEMRAPTPGSPAAAREQTILDEDGVGPVDLARVKNLAEGTRRPAGVPLEGATAEAEPGGTILLRFALPSGAYATTVIDQLSQLDSRSSP